MKLSSTASKSNSQRRSMRLVEDVSLENWVHSVINSIGMLLNLAWDKVADEYLERGWHKLDYYVAKPDQDLAQWN